MRLKIAAVAVYAFVMLCHIGSVVFAALEGNMHLVGVYSFSAGAWFALTLLMAFELKNK